MKKKAALIACSNALPEMEKLVTEYAGKKLPIGKHPRLAICRIPTDSLSVLALCLAGEDTGQRTKAAYFK